MGIVGEGGGESVEIIGRPGKAGEAHHRPSPATGSIAAGMQAQPVGSRYEMMGAVPVLRAHGSALPVSQPAAKLRIRGPGAGRCDRPHGGRIARGAGGMEGRP